MSTTREDMLRTNKTLGMRRGRGKDPGRGGRLSNFCGFLDSCGLCRAGPGALEAEKAQAETHRPEVHLYIASV